MRGIMVPAEGIGIFMRIGRVENRRSGGSLPVACDAAFAAPPQSGLTWLWFLFPLIAPDVQISRIRRSEKAHEFAHGSCAVRSLRQTNPYTL
jgi:hypothetical protein